MSWKTECSRINNSASLLYWQMSPLSVDRAVCISPDSSAYCPNWLMMSKWWTPLGRMNSTTGEMAKLILFLPIYRCFKQWILGMTIKWLIILYLVLYLPTTLFALMPISFLLLLWSRYRWNFLTSTVRSQRSSLRVFISIGTSFYWAI